MRAGVVGAALLEGWADTPEAAERMAGAGEIAFAPCHHYDAVGPMAGIISASMPLIVAEDPATGARAYTNLNEGAGRCLRYGALGDDVMERLRWMNERLGPSLRAALRDLDEPIDLKSITAQALQMGDECHSRNVASSALLTRALAPALARHADIGGVEALDFLRTNDYWFLNFSMVASKLGTMAGHGVEGSTVVTTFARNGVNVGIRVSGLGEAWFTAPAAHDRRPVLRRLRPRGRQPGHRRQRDHGDLRARRVLARRGAGDRRLRRRHGGRGASATSEDMATITVGRHREYQLPVLGFAGSPVGIDVRKVVDSGSSRSSRPASRTASRASGRSARG